MTRTTILMVGLVATLAACSGTSDSAGQGSAGQGSAGQGGGVTAADAGGDANASDVAEGSSELAQAVALMRRMGGLWSGAARQTPLGDFPRMQMDFRAADPNVLFGRVDLDANNALRMAFFIEQINGHAQLVFRNGGLFEGMARDTKMVLVAHDSADTWHFCHPDRGCDYVDAVITFDDADHLIMDVHVRGQQHMIWKPRRVEARELPSPFPATLAPIGTGDADFPAMPTLNVNLSWSSPAPEGAWAWVLLSDTACGLTGTGCEPSRSIGTALTAGETSATLEFDQIHAADYKLNAVLDRDGNFLTSPFPNTGDAVAYPVDKPVTVAQGTNEASAAISVDVP